MNLMLSANTAYLVCIAYFFLLQSDCSCILSTPAIYNTVFFAATPLIMSITYQNTMKYTTTKAM